MATLRQRLEALDPTLAAELDEELLAEAVTAYAAASPLEIAERLSPYVAAASPVADTAPPGDAAFAALQAPAPAAAVPAAGPSWSAWLIAAVVAVTVVGAIAVIVLFRDDAPETAPVATVPISSTDEPTDPEPAVTQPPTTATATTAEPTTTTSAPAPGIEGRWQLEIVVTNSVGPFCELDPPTTVVVTVGPDEDGELGVVGLGDGEEVWAAAFDGTTLRFDGDRGEDGGTTTAAFELVLDGDALDGTEAWDWADDRNACTDGRSTVKGVRLA